MRVLKVPALAGASRAVGYPPTAKLRAVARTPYRKEVDYERKPKER